jgi:kynurenine formamidase
MKLAAGKWIAIGAVGFAAIGAALLWAAGSAEAAPGHRKPKTLYIDLTHTIPTFEPLADKPGEPDLTKPHADSKPVPSFFRQAVLETSTNSTGEHQGHFYRAYLTIADADIDAVADDLDNGSWIVVNTGWSRFFTDASFATSPYINGFNFPGVSLAAIQALVAVENRKGIRVNGIAIDNIGIDHGEGEAGIDERFTNSFQSHVLGLQRGWKFIENATNLAALASAKPDSCTLVAGALPIVRGSGSPARVIAMCEHPAHAADTIGRRK